MSSSHTQNLPCAQLPAKSSHLLPYLVLTVSDEAGDRITTVRKTKPNEIRLCAQFYHSCGLEPSDIKAFS